MGIHHIHKSAMTEESTKNFPQEALGPFESHQSSVTGLANAAGCQDNPVTFTSAVSVGLIPAVAEDVDRLSWPQELY